MLIWPGVPVVQHGSKRARKTLRSNQATEWFPISVVTTSLLFACMTFCLAHPKRQLAERTYAFEHVWRDLVGRLVQSRVACQLWFQRLGDDQWISCQCWANGHELVVGGTAVWTREFYNQVVRLTWDADFRKPDKVWVSQQSGQFEIKLSELLGFMLDPSHFAGLRNMMRPRAVCTISQLAAIVQVPWHC